MDNEPDTFATPTDARNEYAYNYGKEHPQVAWVLTPWDTWEPNPHYRGPKPRHPEDDQWDQ